MKRFTSLLLAFGLMISTLFAQERWTDDLGHLEHPGYGNDERPQKEVDSVLAANSPRKWGVNLTTSLGWSAIHEYGFAQLTANVNYKRIELGVVAAPGITNISDFQMVLYAQAGYKFTINQYFNATPRILLATSWNGEEKISFSGGNRFGFGGDIGYRIANNLDFVASYIKLRTRRNASQDLYASELISAGIRIYIPHRNI